MQADHEPIRKVLGWKQIILSNSLLHDTFKN